MTAAPTIGVVTPFVGGFYFGELLEGVARAVAARGGSTVVIQTLQAGIDRSESFVDPDFDSPVAWDHLSGLIVLVRATSPRYLTAFRATGRPVVMVADRLPGFDCPVVIPDNAGGVRAAVDHLVAHGHRRIAFAGGGGHSDIVERYDGYRAGLLSHGIEPDPELYYDTGGNLQDGGERAAAAMLAAGLPSTALVAATDFNAIGAMRVLRAAGVDLPTQQAVVGFDDSSLGANLRPALSSISQHFSRIGAVAADLVLRELAGEQVPAGDHRTKTTFIPRDSCGCTLGSSIAPVSASGRSPREQLAQRLLEAVEAAVAADRRVAVEALVGALERAVATDGAGTRQVVEAVEALYALAPGVQSARGIVEAVDAFAEALADAAPARRARDCWRRVVVALSDAEVQAQVTANTALQSSLRAQYEISIDLLRAHENDPRSLEWVDRDRASAGCLALWSAGGATGDERQLEVVGRFGAAAPTGAAGDGGPVAAFPPHELLAPAAGRSAELVFLLPVKAGSSDWGWLALVGPVDLTSDSGRERFNQWAALLAVALDHEAAVRSVREKQERLAEAWQRESELLESIRVSEERYALAAAAANDGLWDWDLSDDATYYSPRWHALLGLSAATATTSQDWLSRVHPADADGLQAAILAHVTGAAPVLEHEHRMHRSDGEYRWMLARGRAVRDDSGRCRRIVGSLTDVTERAELDLRLRRAAEHDPLTDLPNRAFFFERLASAISRAEQDPRHGFAVMFLDLDGFKEVNDSLGHAVGDLLLIEVAGVITQSLREGDTAARLGGDEFAVLLDGIRDVDGVRAIAERLRNQLAEPFLLDGQVVTISASIGIATGAERHDTAEDVLRDADTAMYRAKTHQPGSFAEFDQDMRGEGPVPVRR